MNWGKIVVDLQSEMLWLHSFGEVSLQSSSIQLSSRSSVAHFERRRDQRSGSIFQLHSGRRDGCFQGTCWCIPRLCIDNPLSYHNIMASSLLKILFEYGPQTKPASFDMGWKLSVNGSCFPAEKGLLTVFLQPASGSMQFNLPRCTLSMSSQHAAQEISIW